MTDLLDGILGAVVALILNVGILAAVEKRLPGTEGRFLARIYTATLLLRCALAVFLNQYSADSGFSVLFWGDSSTYDVGGYLLAQKWHGEPVSIDHYSRFVSGYGFFYGVAAIYYVFGRNQLLVQFLNATMGAMAVLVLYAIAVELFGATAARRTALCMAFFPQMIFWSAAMYKDPAVLLCIAVSIYAVLKLRNRFSVGSLILFLCSGLVLMTLRFYIAYFVAFSAAATFLFGQRRGGAKSVVAYLFLLAALYGTFTLAVPRETAEQQASYLTLERVQVSRADQAAWGQSAFGRELDVSTPVGALRALPVGLLYLLFAPFPWSIRGLRQALVVPEMLVWYALMPAFMRGLRIAVRDRLREVLPVIVFAGSLTVAYALFQGNVGTAYRQRTQVTMFFFVFMGVGLAEKARQRALTQGRA